MPRPSAGEAVSYRHVESLTALAHLDMARGRHEACERSARAAVQALERELAHPTLVLAEAQAVLGECLLALARPAAAIGVLEPSIEVFRERLGSESWQARRVGELVADARAAGGF